MTARALPQTGTTAETLIGAAVVAVAIAVLMGFTPASLFARRHTLQAAA